MSLSATHYRVSVDPARRQVVIRGPGPRHRWHGSGKGTTRLPVGGMLLWRFRALSEILPVYRQALLCLENPRLSRGLPGKVKVGCPHEYFREKNQGKWRKLFTLEISCYPELALRSTGLVVGETLLQDLRRATQGKMPKAQPLEIHDAEDEGLPLEVQGPPAPQEPGPGFVPGLGQGG